MIIVTAKELEDGTTQYTAHKNEAKEMSFEAKQDMVVTLFATKKAFYGFYKNAPKSFGEYWETTWNSDPEKKFKLLVERYMKLPWTYEVTAPVYGHPCQDWFVKVKELPGCMTQALVMKDVLIEIRAVQREWLLIALEDGFDIPIPEDAPLSLPE